MEVNLSLSSLFERTFGWRTEAFDVQVDEIRGIKEFHRTEQSKLAGAPYYGKDAKGREYYMPVEIQVGHEKMPGSEQTYAEALGVQDNSGAYSGRWNLPFPVLALENRTRIIATELTERRGPVLELINMGGWRITVYGMLINQAAKEFAEDDYTTLIKLRSLNTSFRITSVMTDIALTDGGAHEKDEVVIESLDFVETRGTKHTQGYIMRLIANEPFNLIDIS